MSDTYTEKLVDVLEYFNKQVSRAEKDVVDDPYFSEACAYEDAVETLENLLEDMLSRHRASDNDRETFAAYKARHGDNR
tara:strand:+ start:6624 stop:6860 length:237 start_codon:yes stop_codon:yes gene_type:complete